MRRGLLWLRRAWLRLLLGRWRLRGWHGPRARGVLLGSGRRSLRRLQRRLLRGGHRTLGGLTSVTLGGLAPNDVLLDDDVRRTADQQQVLDVVAAHQNQPAARVQGGRIHHRDARLAVARAAADAHARKPAQDPYKDSDQSKDDQQCDDELEAPGKAGINIERLLQPTVHSILTVFFATVSTTRRA
ncbi:hypothetical protein [Breoghania sp. L-A4]|uniref:hypothetical protein n=1 Tax=Breoghania sp. L-A4 TaxID=2304600 RepID=UPI0020BE0E43|nr:hypothetical protein [Breoghania sp. L-A4]